MTAEAEVLIKPGATGGTEAAGNEGGEGSKLWDSPSLSNLRWEEIAYETICGLFLVRE